MATPLHTLTMPRDSAHIIQTDELLNAYRLGYFPMAQSRDDEDIVWILPDERGIIPLDCARAPSRLLRTVKTEPFEITINKAFPEVITACAEETNARPDTWINDLIIETYIALHREGHAHSIECWQNDQLVGGCYGIALGTAFCGESMFSRATDASKIAMLYLIARLKLGGFEFIDAQFYNDHLTQFGLIGVPNEDYQKMLKTSLTQEGNFFAAKDQLDAARVVQLITQTS